MIVFKKSKYYTRGTPEYNKRFARKIFCRALKKILIKIIKVIIILGIIFALVYWMAVVIKVQII